MVCERVFIARLLGVCQMLKFCGLNKFGRLVQTVCFNEFVI